MKESLFRIWDYKEKCWVSGSNNRPFDLIGEYTLFDGLGKYGLYKDVPKYVENIIISQFTGMKDCEGNKIFEYDYLYSDDRDMFYCVVYAEDKARFVLRNKYGDFNMYKENMYALNYTIVGNSFEHSEEDFKSEDFKSK